MEPGEVFHHGIQFLGLSDLAVVHLLVQHALNRPLETLLDGEIHQAVAGFHLAATGQNTGIFNDGSGCLQAGSHLADHFTVFGIYMDPDVFSGGG